MTRNRVFRFLAPALATGLMASCNAEKEVLKIEDAYVNLNPVTGAPSAMYFEIHGGPDATELLSVVSEDVIKIEMHESGKDAATGAMTMNPVTSVAIPARGVVEFKPGGMHVMLWGLNRVPVISGTLTVQFVFGNGERQEVDVPVRKVGDASSGNASSHTGHDDSAKAE